MRRRPAATLDVAAGIGRRGLPRFPGASGLVDFGAAGAEPAPA